MKREAGAKEAGLETAPAGWGWATRGVGGVQETGRERRGRRARGLRGRRPAAPLCTLSPPSPGRKAVPSSHRKTAEPRAPRPSGPASQNEPSTRKGPNSPRRTVQAPRRLSPELPGPSPHPREPRRPTPGFLCLVAENPPREEKLWRGSRCPPRAGGTDLPGAARQEGSWVPEVRGRRAARARRWPRCRGASVPPGPGVPAPPRPQLGPKCLCRKTC